MKYLVNKSTDPHYNMAFDQWCLENLREDEPVFCLWRNRPSVIIGLNQVAEQEVNLPFIESRGIALARRVTGGGAVYHDLQNLNYSIFGKTYGNLNDEADPDTDLNPAIDTAAFVNALKALGVDARVTGRNDIFLDGKKISGYARRVWKNRTLVHGTLMWNVDIATLTEALAAPGSKLSKKGIASVRSRVANLKDYLTDYDSLDALQAALHQQLAGSNRAGGNDNVDGEIILSPEQLSEIQTLADQKFASHEWIFRL